MSIDVTGVCEVCGNQFAYAKVKKSQPDKRTCSKKCSYALRKRTRHVIHDPIEKECHICSKRWNDIHA
jgi:hypothetical protein